jgi:hypothetical protein
MFVFVGFFQQQQQQQQQKRIWRGYNYGYGVVNTDYTGRKSIWGD